MKLAERLGGGVLTERVCCDVAICCGEPLSWTVRDTVNDPAEEYVWVTDDPVPDDPSPKAQLNV